jgi:NAD(P)-dependent dehydrogenase (short-subunit alcohol dehydrogenase family)
MARIFITGSTNGIGQEAASQLIALGHEVVGHARDGERADAARAELPGLADVLVGDLASLSATEALAASANEAGPFDVVVHNAALGALQERGTTVDGFERIFQVNVLAPYVLSALMPVAPRAIYLTSGVAYAGDMSLADHRWEQREWDGSAAYRDSKLAVLALAMEFAERHPQAAVNAINPGWTRTGLKGTAQAPNPTNRGAELLVFMAHSDDPVAKASGQFVDHNDDPWKVADVPDAAADPAARARLLGLLEELTGVALPR